MSDPQRRAEVEGRIETVRRLLHERRAGGVMLSTRHNFSWLTRGGVNHVLMATQNGAVPLVVTARDVIALAPTNEADRIAEEELDGLPIEVRPVPWHDDAAGRRLAEAEAGGALLDDVDLEADLLMHRSRLGPVEHERMVVLGRLAVSAAETGLAAVTSGDTETDAVAAMTEMVARNDARAPVVLAAADARIARYRHPLPAGAEIHRRLMLVLVVERWGLHAAVTRIRELEPPDAELARRNEAAAGILEAMHSATRPGAMLGAVLSAAQSAYRDSGFAHEWELHHQGGSIGYQSRERIAVPGDGTPIEPGMAFAWNPSITGAKAEETLLLLPDGGQRVVTRPS
jgi:Xaa-Pro aminopeptidase